MKIERRIGAGGWHEIDEKTALYRLSGYYSKIDVVKKALEIGETLTTGFADYRKQRETK